MAHDNGKVIETRFRSIIKGLVWRGLASLATVLLVYLFSGDMVMAGRIGVLEVIVKLLLYYSHERVWNVISWGRMSE